MPHTAPQPPGARLVPVPVAVMLPPPDPARRAAPRRGQPPDWCGLTPRTAARAPGLRYHQHLIALREPLPEHEPRAEPDTAATTTPQLIDGRHAPTHTNLLVFAAPGGQEASDA